MNFKNKKVTVMGLGLHGGGEGLVRYLAKEKAIITVTDLKTELELRKTLQKLEGLEVNYQLGGHEWSDFKGAEIVFLNPAVPKDSLWVKKILKAGIPISSEMNLFFQKCPGKIIGITGTNGKSTTATLAFEILKNKFMPVSSLDDFQEIEDSGKKRKIYFGGNIGGSLLDYLDQMQEKDLILLELSSFQLYDLGQIKISPHVAAILNITADHLDQHKNFQEYLEAKKNILKFQTETDFAILNYDQKLIQKISEKIASHILFFSTKTAVSKGAYLDEKNIIVNFRGKKYDIITTPEVKILGLHNIKNIMTAVIIGLLYGIETKEITRTVRNFSGLTHRLEFVKEINNVSYYNDSKSTTPESTIAALKTFEKPILLICGGKDKKSDLSKLAENIPLKVKYLFLIGEIAEKIKKEVDAKINTSEKSILKKIFISKTLKNATEKAKNLAKKDEIVLLSSATSSFDQFENFEERGEKFKELVRR